jgi:Ca2+/Na+ antiporter
MSAEETLSLKRLPPQVREAVKTKRILGKKRLREWLGFLPVLSRFDAQVDVRLKKVQGRSMLFGVSFFVALLVTILGTVASDGNIRVVSLTGGVLIVFLLLFIIYRIKVSRLKKNNLDNSFRDTLLPLLQILSEDIPPKGKIFLDLNLEDPVAKGNMISEQKFPPGRMYNLIERVYRSKIVHAVIPLTNGARLILDIVKQPASFDRYYTNSRGKHKHKQKWKMLTLVTTSLIPPVEDFSVDAAKVDRMAEQEKVKLKEKTTGELCRLTRKFKSKSVAGVPEEFVPPELLVDMFMKLCTMLNPAG